MMIEKILPCIHNKNPTVNIKETYKDKYFLDKNTLIPRNIRSNIMIGVA
jgi:hypothetical protein